MIIIISSALNIAQSLSRHEYQLFLTSFWRAASKVFLGCHEQHKALLFVESALDKKNGLSEYLKAAVVRTATALASSPTSSFEDVEDKVLRLVLQDFKDVRTCLYREELLRLLAIVIRRVSDVKIHEFDDQLCEERTKGAFVEALKTSLLSESLVVRSLVVDLINGLRRFDKIVTVLVEIGIVDFLFEGLGVQGTPETKDQVDEIRTKILEAISYICDTHVDVLHKIMRHRLVTILEALSDDKDGSMKRLAFALIRKGFSTPKFLDVESVEMFFVAVRSTGIQFDRGSKGQKKMAVAKTSNESSSEAIFSSALVALHELLSWYRVPKSIRGCLWETLDCIGRVTPRNVSGIRAACCAIEQFIDAEKDKDSDYPRMIQEVVMATWVSQLNPLIDGSCDIDLMFLSALLKLLYLTAQLDIYLETNFKDTGKVRNKFLWQNLSPKRLFDLVEVHSSDTPKQSIPESDNVLGVTKAKIGSSAEDVNDGASEPYHSKSDRILDPKEELLGNVKRYLYCVLLKMPEVGIENFPYDHGSFKQSLECDEPWSKGNTSKLYSSLLLLAGNYWWSSSPTALLLSPENALKVLLKLAMCIGQRMRRTNNSYCILPCSLLVDLLSRINQVSASTIDQYDTSEDVMWFLTCMSTSGSTEALHLIILVFNGSKRNFSGDCMAGIWKVVGDAKLQPSAWKIIKPLVIRAVEIDNAFLTSMILVLSSPDMGDESTCSVILDILAASDSAKSKICDMGLISTAEDLVVMRYQNRNAGRRNRAISNILNAIVIVMTKRTPTQVHTLVVKLTEASVKSDFERDIDTTFRLSCVRFLVVVLASIDPHDSSRVKTISHLAGDASLMRMMFSLAFFKTKKHRMTLQSYIACSAAVYLRILFSHLRRIASRYSSAMSLVPSKRLRSATKCESQNCKELLEVFTAEMKKRCRSLLMLTTHCTAPVDTYGDLFLLVAVNQLYANWLIFMSTGPASKNRSIMDKRLVDRLRMQLMSLSMDEGNRTSLYSLVQDSSLLLLAASLVQDLASARVCIARISFQRHIAMLLDRLISFPSTVSPSKLMYLSAFIPCLKIRKEGQKASEGLQCSSSFVNALLRILTREVHCSPQEYRIQRCAIIVTATFLKEVGFSITSKDSIALKEAMKRAQNALSSEKDQAKSEFQKSQVQALRHPGSLKWNSLHERLFVGRNILYLSNYMTSEGEAENESQVICETIFHA